MSRTKSENIFLKATKKGARKEKIKTRKAKNLEIRSKKESTGKHEYRQREGREIYEDANGVIKQKKINSLKC